MNPIEIQEDIRELQVMLVVAKSYAKVGEELGL